MEYATHTEAYPGIEYHARSRNWWAWLKGTAPECVHLEHEHSWVVTLIPDTLYLRGKRAVRRDPVRPEVVLCRDCLTEVAIGDMEQYGGKVAAFEPRSEFTQYFFVAAPDFEAAGLAPEVRTAIQERLDRELPPCSACEKPSTWLWFSREEVAGLDEVSRIRERPGEPFCAAHGVRKLCSAFEKIAEADLYYMNLPYGESGAYVGIG
ncbi:MAG: hypothetical protein ACRD4S_10750 [Candidatus Acidiferrales bacterium]